MWGEPEITDIDEIERGLPRLRRARASRHVRKESIVLTRRLPAPPSMPRRELVALLLAVLFFVVATIGAAVSGGGAPSAVPSGVAEATIGAVKSTVALDGVVVREADQDVTSPTAGTISDLNVSAGDTVHVGDNLATVTVLVLVPVPTPSPSASSTPTPTPTLTPSPENRTVLATADGEVTNVNVAEGEQVGTGQSLVTISPNRYDIVAPVAPNLLPQFYTQPLSIQASVDQGPQPFDCSFISMGGNLPSGEASKILNQEVDLRCLVPTAVPVFPGVRARVAATTAQVSDALLIPVGAVQPQQGQTDTGVVWLVEKGLAPVQRTVTLGISDGKVIQIVSGLVVGQRVLNPAPTNTPVAPATGPLGQLLSPAPSA